MATDSICVDVRDKLLDVIERRMSRNRLLAMTMLLAAVPASAIPPPPLPPPKLREARMTVMVQLVEASNGTVTNRTKLCEISGAIPVYSDGGGATGANTREISGCRMAWKGKSLSVSVRGAMAIARGPVTYATATVAAVPPDAIPLCSVCAPQPLANSTAEIRVSGTPKSLTFSLNQNPVSLLKSKPTVWLEADVAIAD